MSPARVICRAQEPRNHASMQKVAPPAPATTRPLWMVILAAGLIVGIAMGLRQVMGLYLPPMTKELGIGREPFSTAMAVANLVWGIGAIFAGMIADRYGAGRVVVAGTLATMAGMYLMYAAQSGFDLLISGVLLGIGVSGTGLNCAGRRGRPRRAAREAHQRHRLARHGRRHRRVRRLSLHAPAHGPFGWKTSLLLLLATTAVMLPLAWPLAGKPDRRRRPGRHADAGCGLQGGPHASELPAAGHRLLRVRLPRGVLRRAPAGVRGRQGARPQRRRHRPDHGGPRQSRRHLHRRAVRALHREAPGAEPHLLRPLLHLPRAAVPADHARRRSSGSASCSGCSGSPRCR